MWHSEPWYCEFAQFELLRLPRLHKCESNNQPDCCSSPLCTTAGSPHNEMHSTSIASNMWLTSDVTWTSTAKLVRWFEMHKTEELTIFVVIPSALQWLYVEESGLNWNLKIEKTHVHARTGTTKLWKSPSTEILIVSFQLPNYQVCIVVPLALVSS